MLLNDEEIRKRCTDRSAEYIPAVPPRAVSSFPMIDPFSEAVSGNGIISYGLTSAGYDIRLGPEVWVFKNTSGDLINPKLFGDEEYRKKMFDVIIFPDNHPVIIPAHSYILARSLEYFRIPREIKARCVGKSTLARSGVLINTTPLEPEWEGFLTIEIGNITPCPLVIFTAEGIAQVEFETLVYQPKISYKDKQGVYQSQIGVTPSQVR